MWIKIDDDFRSIADEIIIANNTVDQWAQLESDDMFHAGLFEGGFDETERAFCFSYENDAGEFWFQLTLYEIERVSRGEITEIEARSAD